MSDLPKVSFDCRADQRIAAREKGGTERVPLATECPAILATWKSAVRVRSPPRRRTGPGTLRWMYVASMHDFAELLAIYDNEVRQAETTNFPPGVYAEADGPIVRVIGNHRGFIGSPVHIVLDGDALDALIARQRDFFTARDQTVEWKTRCHDTPADIADRLIAAGFIAEERETVLMASAKEISRQSAPAPTGVVVRRTTADEDIRRIVTMKLEDEPFDGGEVLNWLADDLILRLHSGQDELAVFVAEAGDQMVAAAWMAHEPGAKVAGFWGGSTLTAWRRRGIYRSLVTQRSRLAVACGAQCLHVDASDNSCPILKKLGFVEIATTTPYIWTPKST